MSTLIAGMPGRGSGHTWLGSQPSHLPAMQLTASFLPVLFVCAVLADG